MKNTKMKEWVYYEHYPVDTPKKERQKAYIGSIFKNQAKCLLCGETIISKNRHDYVSCSCGNVSVDGGSWYARRSIHEEDKYNDLSIYYEEI
jgi:hypothetical protein